MLTKILRYCIFYVTLLAAWFGLTASGDSSLTLIIAFIAPLATLLLASWFKLIPRRKLKIFAFLSYCLWILKEIISSSIAVTRIIWRKDLAIIPMLQPVKTIQSNDLGTVIYSNSITLTPGTVTLSAEAGHVFVHALDVAFMEDVQGGEMDQRVKKVIIEKEEAGEKHR